MGSSLLSRSRHNFQLTDAFSVRRVTIRENELGDQAPANETEAVSAEPAAASEIDSAAPKQESKPSAEEDEEDFGGLMSAIKKGAQSKGKKGKKKKQDDLDWDELEQEAEQLDTEKPNQAIAEETQAEKEGSVEPAKQDNNDEQGAEGDAPRVSI